MGGTIRELDIFYSNFVLSDLRLREFNAASMVGRNHGDDIRVTDSGFFSLEPSALPPLRDPANRH